MEEQKEEQKIFLCSSDEKINSPLIYLILVSFFLIEMTKLKIDHIAAETSTTKYIFIQTP